MEEQEIQMNSTHQDSQRNTGNEAFSRDEPQNKQTSKVTVRPNKNISSYSVLICRKVSGSVNATEESKKGLEISI